MYGIPVNVMTKLICMNVCYQIMGRVLLTALLNQTSLFYAIELNESAVDDFSKAKKEVYVAAAAQLQGHPGIYHCIYTFYPD